MELVKLSHENIDREHICCAIANEKDIQVVSKKNWLRERLDEGLGFLKGNVRGSALSSIFPPNMPGRPSRQRAICILTACGCPDSLKDMDIRAFC